MSWTPTTAELDAGENVLAECLQESPDGYWRPAVQAVLEAAHAAAAPNPHLTELAPADAPHEPTGRTWDPRHA